MNQPIHNDYWLSRFESILNSALVQHRAVSLIPHHVMEFALWRIDKALPPVVVFHIESIPFMRITHGSI